MARPRVFVSSTYYDLKHIRASLETFIGTLGFDSVLFEKGDISFHPDMSLDESCYREAASADIFVLVIGGRYGSAASSSLAKIESKFQPSFESITKREFDTAQQNDVPTFILVESSVASEYRTYLKNKDNTSIEYAHVDSPDVFKLLESIYEKVKNNPVFHFEKATQIEIWLREQWAGLFRELLSARNQQKQLSALNHQVQELKLVNDTLKSYLEEMLLSSNKKGSEDIIKKADDEIKQKRSKIYLESNEWYKYLRQMVDNDDFAEDVIRQPNTADQAIEIIDGLVGTEDGKDPMSNPLRTSGQAQVSFNLARSSLNLPELNFLESSDYHVVRTAERNRSRIAAKIALRARRTKGPSEDGTPG